jgi:arginine/lysine/ornithine decarboxylase
LPLNECYNKEEEMIPFSEAVGRISLDIKSPCPPGCIVLDIGQRIKEEHLKFFNGTEMVAVWKQS